MKAYVLFIVLLLLVAGCANQPAVCQKKDTKLAMTVSEAFQIAKASPCTAEGIVQEGNMCNDFTGTIWFDMKMNVPKEGCNPACVVNIESRAAEINWRCTGLIQPKK